ncbi:S8 family serine peptidase [Thermoflexus sp.]|uniref:S8 family serine peptidase n=1 Tax=Thermoflexus sp. TaxID=1969742 RepID=UPI002ADD3B46|nr:S8 family serine peptidase [Thermoflexus sp.]
MKHGRWLLLLGVIVLIGSFSGAPASGSSETAPTSAGPECFLPLEDGRCLPSPVPADAAPPPPARPQAASIPRRPGVVVKRRDAVAPGAFRSALAVAGFPNAEALAVPRWWRIPVPPGQDPERVAEQLRRHPAVEIAEVEREVRIAATPNDPYYGSYQWNLPRIRAPQAWDLTTGSSSVWIAVIDTGVDYTHPDLSSSRIWLGYDFVNNDPDPMDDEGHGTHVAGIAGANTNNSVGIAGVCWHCDLLAVKVLDQEGSGYDTDVADGIRYAVDWGAAHGKRTIINLSLGGSYPSSALADAVSYARSRGALLVAAAGNRNTSAPFYPAAYPGVIGVSATNSSDQRASFSNYGSYVDIAAPGVSILSTYPSNVYPYGYLYLWASGTSMAAPHVAGVAGLVWSRRPTLTPDGVCDLLLSTADDLGVAGRDDFFGYGRLDAYEAVWAAQPPASSPPLLPGSYRLYLPLVMRNWVPICP